MTANKPEVVGFVSEAGIKNLRERNYACDWTLYAGPVRNSTTPLIRLSDYEALQAECEKLRKDAERYRYLADECCAEWCGEKGPVLVHATPWTCNWRVELDAAIDTAMETTK